MRSVEALQATLDEVLGRFKASLGTEAIALVRGEWGRAARVLQQVLGAGGEWLVAADEVTWGVAGAQITGALSELGQPWRRYVVEANEGERWAMCDDGQIARFEEALRAGGYSAGLAVGSGTINDIAKMASHRCGVPMGCVATAPSMNGYTSGIAALLSAGVKTTEPCAPARVVIADVEVMAAAPYRMIASGLGDLLSKPVSNADWALSAMVLGTPHSAQAREVIELGSEMLDGVAERLPERDVEAVAGLTGSLMLSGLAMSIAGSSSPASGGEHLISHYLDMTAHTFDLPYDFHGCQVGVGTLTAALLYERLWQMGPAGIDVAARVAALPSWQEYEARLRERFGPLSEAVVSHARRGYPSGVELERRLTVLKEGWEAFYEEASRTLRTRGSIEAELVSAQAPVRYAQLDVGRERAREAIVWSKDIRARYTILHLCWELGVLEEWAEEALEALYGE
jgi:glycerol-1-phosphate dehydrogenase [NAD(P)+]